MLSPLEMKKSMELNSQNEMQDHSLILNFVAGKHIDVPTPLLKSNKLLDVTSLRDLGVNVEKVKKKV